MSLCRLATALLCFYLGGSWAQGLNGRPRRVEFKCPRAVDFWSEASCQAQYSQTRVSQGGGKCDAKIFGVNCCNYCVNNGERPSFECKDLVTGCDEYKKLKDHMNFMYLLVVRCFDTFVCKPTGMLNHLEYGEDEDSNAEMRNPNTIEEEEEPSTEAPTPPPPSPTTTTSTTTTTKKTTTIKTTEKATTTPKPTTRKRRPTSTTEETTRMTTKKTTEAAPDVESEETVDKATETNVGAGQNKEDMNSKGDENTEGNWNGKKSTSEEDGEDKYMSKQQILKKFIPGRWFPIYFGRRGPHRKLIWDDNEQ